MNHVVIEYSCNMFRHSRNHHQAAALPGWAVMYPDEGRRSKYVARITCCPRNKYRKLGSEYYGRKHWKQSAQTWVRKCFEPTTGGLTVVTQVTYARITSGVDDVNHHVSTTWHSHASIYAHPLRPGSDRINCCWPSPAHSFLVASSAVHMTMFYCLTTLSLSLSEA
jgi:hypothetical protein